MNKRECLNCGREIRESMGFCLGRDILNRSKKVREFCEICSWKVDPRGINNDSDEKMDDRERELLENWMS